MAGPGYRSTATIVADQSGDGMCETTIVTASIWVKVGTKIQYSSDNGVTFYDTGVTVTAGERTGMIESPDGDVLAGNQIDSGLRFAVATLNSALSDTDGSADVGTIYQSKFGMGTGYLGTGTILIRGDSITYNHQFTADAGTDFVTCTNHGFSNNDIVQVVNSGGALPAGLSASTNYYVINKTANTFQLSSSSGGSAINITDVGSGTNYFTTTDGKLHGLSGIQSGGHPIDVIVVQSSNPSTWTDKGNILAVYQSGSFAAQLIVAGIVNSPSKVAWSGPFSFAHPEYFTDFGTGNGGGFNFMPSKVMGVITGTAASYVIQDRYISSITGIDSTTGDLLFQIINNQYGAYNANCIVDMDGVVMFMGKKRAMPIVLAISPQAQSISQLDENFDKDIRPWLDSHDDTDQQQSAFLKWDSTQKIVKFGAVVGGELQCQIHDRQNGRFLGYEQRKVGSSCMHKGMSFFLHTDNGKLYQDDTGRTNDTTPITHIMSTGRIEYDRGRRFLEGKVFRHEGWMMQGTIFTLRIYIEGATTASFEQEYDDSLITSNSGRSVGLRTGGISVPGGSVTESIMVYPFENDIIIAGLNGKDFRFEWEISNEGAFLINSTWYFSSFVTPNDPTSST